jgi:uncharacterized protein Yka (UPF0111/DUF47 family)
MVIRPPQVRPPPEGRMEGAMLEHLFPNRQEFYGALAQLAGRVTRAAELLGAGLAEPGRDGSDGMDAMTGRIREVRGAADALADDLNRRADEVFIPPFDREDIHAITTRLRHVIDQISDIARHGQDYRVAERRAPAVELARILHRATAALESAVTSLRDSDTVLARCRQVRDCEEEADAVWDRAVASLFQGGDDPIQVLMWKDLYDLLEDAVDECDDVADALESMAVKHSA